MTTTAEEIRQRVSEVHALLGSIARGGGTLDPAQVKADVRQAIHRLETLLHVLERRNGDKNGN